jgi:hypothetical protein
MREKHPVAVAVVCQALQDFETRSEGEDILKVIDYVRLLEEMEESFAALPENITLRWADKWKATTLNEQ